MDFKRHIIKVEEKGGLDHAYRISREGIEAVKQSRPDLVILDIRLPDMTGLEVFEVIHELHPKLPVIIITAFGSTDTAIGAIQKGAYDYITKPFSPREFIARVKAVLRRDEVENKSYKISHNDGQRANYNAIKQPQQNSDRKNQKPA